MDDRFGGGPHWHKSTRSADSDCVEVAIDGDVVRVRDSHCHEPELEFAAADWTAFIHFLNAGGG